MLYAKCSENVLNIEKVCPSMLKAEKLREMLNAEIVCRVYESMRECAKSWKSMRKCAKSWESLLKANVLYAVKIAF